MKKKFYLLIAFIIICISFLGYANFSQASQSYGTIQEVYLKYNSTSWGTTFKFAGDHWEYKTLLGPFPVWRNVKNMPSDPLFSANYRIVAKSLSSYTGSSGTKLGLTYLLVTVRDDNNLQKATIITNSPTGQLGINDIRDSNKNWAISGDSNLIDTKATTPTPTPTPTATGTPTPPTPTGGGTVTPSGGVTPTGTATPGAPTSGTSSGTSATMPAISFAGLENKTKFDSIMEFIENNVIKIIEGIGIAGFVIVFIIAGLQYISSAGNEEAMEHAKNTIINAIIGIIIIALASSAIDYFYRKAKNPTFQTSTPASTNSGSTNPSGNPPTSATPSGSATPTSTPSIRIPDPDGGTMDVEPM